MFGTEQDQTQSHKPSPRAHSRYSLRCRTSCSHPRNDASSTHTLLHAIGLRNLGPHYEDRPSHSACPQGDQSGVPPLPPTARPRYITGRLLWSYSFRKGGQPGPLSTLIKTAPPGHPILATHFLQGWTMRVANDCLLKKY